MKIKNKFEIAIKNYKTIKNIYLSLNKKAIKNIITLIGNNNAGKSNILDAIYKAKGLKPFKNSDVPKYKFKTISVIPSLEMNIIFFDDEFNENVPISIKIHEDIEYGIDKEYIEKVKKSIEKLIEKLKKTKLDTTGAYIQDSRETFRLEYKYLKFIDKIRCSNLPEKEKDDILKLSEQIKQKYYFLSLKNEIEIRYLKSVNIFKYSVLDLELLDKDSTSLNERERDQKDYINIWENVLNISFSDLLRESNSKNKNREAYSFLKAFNERATNAIEGILKEVSNDIFNYKLDLEISDNKLYINVKQERKDKNDYIWEENPEIMGDGLKSLWSYIFLMLSIKSNKPTIILMDEPEKYLNPTYQKLLSTWIFNRYDGKNRPNQYVIMVTHSPFMIGNDFYENTYVVERNFESENETHVKRIWETKTRNTPNLLLDKNSEIRYLESLWSLNESSNILFLEGISDYNVISNISPKTFIIILFGDNFENVVSYHLPYINASNKKIKLLVDDDRTGTKIRDWFLMNTNIEKNDAMFYSNFFPNKNTLEDSILKPWFDKNNLKMIENKKVDSLIFKNKNIDVESYDKLKKWIEEINAN